MKIRLYQPVLEADPVPGGSLNFYATLGECRTVASAIASQGQRVLVRVWLIEGPDTDVVIALLGAGLTLGQKAPHWSCTDRERHQSTVQIAIPGDGPIPWAVEIVKPEPTDDVVEGAGE